MQKTLKRKYLSSGTSGSPRGSWKTLLGRTSGLPSLACCHCDPAWEKRHRVDGWMDGCVLCHWPRSSLTVFLFTKHLLHTYAHTCLHKWTQEAVLSWFVLPPVGVSVFSKDALCHHSNLTAWGFFVRKEVTQHTSCYPKDNLPHAHSAQAQYDGTTYLFKTSWRCRFDYIHPSVYPLAIPAYRHHFKPFCAHSRGQDKVESFS